jgi:hypothetical protein
VTEAAQEYFSNLGPPLFLVIKEYDYTNFANQVRTTEREITFVVCFEERGSSSVSFLSPPAVSRYWSDADGRIR